MRTLISVDMNGGQLVCTAVVYKYFFPLVIIRLRLRPRRGSWAPSAVLNTKIKELLNQTSLSYPYQTHNLHNSNSYHPFTTELS